MDDDERLTALMEQRWEPLVRSTTLVVLDRSTAEDLVQDAFVVLHARWRRLQDPQAAEAYVRQTVLREARRRRSRRIRVEVAERLPEQPVADGVDQRAVRTTVREALARLPLPQRAVVVLRHLDGLSEAETAAALGIRPGTVKSRLSRALAALRDDGLLTPDLLHPDPHDRPVVPTPPGAVDA